IISYFSFPFVHFHLTTYNINPSISFPGRRALSGSLVVYGRKAFGRRVLVGERSKKYGLYWGSHTTGSISVDGVILCRQHNSPSSDPITILVCGKQLYLTFYGN
ncbi:hypothetical protein Q0590_35630, partial [Rhodocytophaga aerolata]